MWKSVASELSATKPLARFADKKALLEADDASMENVSGSAEMSQVSDVAGEIEVVMEADMELEVVGNGEIVLSQYRPTVTMDVTATVVTEMDATVTVTGS